MPTALEKHIDESRYKPISFAAIALMMFAILSSASSSFSTTKVLSQIVTPELQPEGNLSLSLQIQDKRIANPYELQAELGLTKWADVAVFRGFQPDDWNLRDGDRIVNERALSSFRWVPELVASSECRSSTVYRSWLLHGASQSYRRGPSCRLQKRSNPRLRLRFQSDVASTGRLDKRF